MKGNVLNNVFYFVRQKVSRSGAAKGVGYGPYSGVR